MGGGCQHGKPSKFRLAEHSSCRRSIKEATVPILRLRAGLTLRSTWAAKPHLPSGGLVAMAEGFVVPETFSNWQTRNLPVIREGSQNLHATKIIGRLASSMD